jgi:hypothetical protein
MAKPTRCSRCGRENDPARASCRDCGEALLPAPGGAGGECAACGSVLEPGFRFCGICGAAVRTTPADPAGAAAGPRAGPRAPPPLPGGAPRASAPRFRLTTIRSDGGPGPSFPIGGRLVCGRTEGEVRLGGDPTVSPRHARFTESGGVLRVEDLGSMNGTFLRLREQRRITVGEEIRLGRQLLRIEPLPRPPLHDGNVRPWGAPDPGSRFRLSQILEGGGVGDVFPLRDGENAIGREAGEVTFPADRYVSGRHARVDVSGPGLTLADTGSSNGTFVRISGVAELAAGDQLLVGRQLLRIDG